MSYRVIAVPTEWHGPEGVDLLEHVAKQTFGPTARVIEDPQHPLWSAALTRVASQAVAQERDFEVVDRERGLIRLGARKGSKRPQWTEAGLRWVRPVEVIDETDGKTSGGAAVGAAEEAGLDPSRESDGD